jgi:hypothetical protein
MTSLKHPRGGLRALNLAVAMFLLASGLASAQPMIFSADFDTNATALWTVNNGPGSNLVNFFFDYSEAGVPSAPHSAGGTTHGLKLQPNMDPLDQHFPSGLSVSPTAFALPTDFEIRFDLWLNYPQSLNGSTIVAGAGFGTAGTSPQIAGLGVDSIFFATTPDGGSANDYRAYTPAQPTGIQSIYSFGVYVADAQNNTAPYYTNNFPAQPVPHAQASLFPAQNGLVAPAGALAFGWHEVVIHKLGNGVTWHIDGVLIATLDMASTNVTDFRTVGGNKILFNCFDVNDNASTDPDAFGVLFALIDNVRVSQPANVVSVSSLIPTASESGLVVGNPSPVPGVFRLTRNFSGTPLTVNYTLAGTASNGVDYISLPGSATFGATNLFTDVVLTPINDALHEGAEFIIFSVNDTANYFGGSSRMILQDDEALAVDDAFALPVNGSLALHGLALLTNDVASSASGLNTNLTIISMSSTSAAGGIIAFIAGGQTLWTNLYNGDGGTGVDQANAIQVDSSNNVLVSGYSLGKESSFDFATIKYSGAGIPLWTNRYNGPGNADDEAVALVLDQSNNVVVTGFSFTNNYDYATIKYSSSGTPLWTNRYNGPGTGFNIDKPAGITYDNKEGSFYVTGLSAGNGTDTDFATLKYSGAGMAVWTNRYNGPGNLSDEARAIDFNDGIFVTGTIWGLGSFDYATIKYSTNGVPVWTNRFNGTGNFSDQPVAVVTDNSGNVIITGTSYRTSADFSTISYSSGGSLQWGGYFDGGNNSADQASAMTVDQSGNIFVTGYSSAGGNGNDIVVIKYSNSGAGLWTNYFNGTENLDDRSVAVKTDGEGNVVVAGYTTASGANGGVNCVTIKYSAAGALLWTNLFNGSGNSTDQSTGLALDSNGDVLISGFTTSSGTSSDYLTLKLNGETSFIYTPPNNFSGVDTFTYVVRDSYGFTATGTVTITVGEPGIPLHSVERQGTEFVARYIGSPGVSYTIESLASLTAPLNWQKFTNVVAPTTDVGFGLGVFEFRSSTASPEQRFYRARFPAY